MLRRQVIRFLFPVTIALIAVAGAWMWTHRVELFEIPRAWDEVLELHASKRARDIPKLTKYDLDPEIFDDVWDPKFDRAVRRLVSLQNLDFSSSQNFELTRAQAVRGVPCYVLRCGPRASEGEDDWGWFHSHLIALDSRGRVLGRAPVTVDDLVDTVRVVGRLPNGSDLIRAGNGDRLEDELYVDRDGIVSLGSRLPGPLRVPLEPLDPPHETDDKPNALETSPLSLAGWHRALTLHKRSADRFVELLTHPDEDLRARAAATMVFAPKQWKRLRPLLDDPSPRVRAAAACSLVVLDVEFDIWPWVQLEQNRHVRIHVLERLQYDDDENKVARVMIRLLQNDVDAWAQRQIYSERLRANDVCQAVVEFLDRVTVGYTDDSPVKFAASLWQVGEFSDAQVAQHLPKLLIVCERLLKTKSLSITQLLLAIARSKHPDARRLIAEILQDSKTPSVRVATCLIGSVRNPSPKINRRLAAEMNRRKGIYDRDSLIQIYLSEALAWRGEC
ncbi:MAG: hypothetical protein AAF517_22135, partial [Planctomycetota bacterium]